MNNKQDFSKCKIGDHLWSIQLGECEVTRIDGGYVMVRNFLSEKCAHAYEQDGRRNISHAHQSLFFSNPNIVAPPPPPPERKIELDIAKFHAIWQEVNGCTWKNPNEARLYRGLMDKLGF